MNLPLKLGKPLKCRNCGTEFRTGRKHGGKFYCSRGCWKIHWKGKNTHMFGKSCSEGSKKASKIRFTGKTNPNWKGGVSKKNHNIRGSIEFRLWREAVFARDNWTCQKYGTKGGKLHPHHIQNFSQFPELRFAIDNGITLSERAHREFHKKYGKKNNTREQLLEFIS
jgi:hypothetical protein